MKAHPSCPKCVSPLGTNPDCDACRLFSGAKTSTRTPLARSTLPASTPTRLLAAIAGALAIGGALAWFPASNTYGALFAEFGGELPGITRLALSGIYPALILVAPGALIALALRTDRPAIASAALTAVFVVGGTFMFAMYLPVFRLADAVQ